MKFFLIMQTDLQKKIEDAIFAFSIGSDVEAESLLLEIVAQYPYSLDAQRALAEVSLALKKLDQAEDACRKALGISPDDLTSVVSLARILVQKGDKEGAEVASAKARLLGWKEELSEEDSGHQ